MSNGTPRGTRRQLLLLPGVLLALASAPVSQGEALPMGAWRAWLDSPGGELPFGLVLEETARGLVAGLINGDEHIPLAPVVRLGDELILSIPHYDSRIEASWSSATRTLDGRWTKRSGATSWAELPFHASPGEQARFPPPQDARQTGRRAVDGRWRVHFESSAEPAIAIFETQADGSLHGTFLTTTGDYRYLAGSQNDDRVQLSCFDGAHAFLFSAQLSPEDELSGDFWSRDSWHETWTATRDETITLPDAFTQTSALAGPSFWSYVFPDLDGEAHALAAPEYAGEVLVVQLFGSWCPNCHDETRALVELSRRYAGRGVRVLGLAFELTGERERDAHQVREFQRHHGADWPVLIAGTANKARATQAFPFIDRLRSYPTTLFFDRAGELRRIHTGWTGPATGAAHDELLAEFEAQLEELAAEPPPDRAELVRHLLARPWFEWSAPAGARVAFSQEGGRIWAERSALQESGEAVTQRLPVELGIHGLRLGKDLLSIDRAAMTLRSPFDLETRLAPDGLGVAPLLARMGLDHQDALRHEDPVVRREAVFALVESRSTAGQGGLPDALALLSDDSLDVRSVAAWAVGVQGEAAAEELLYESLGSGHAPLRREAARALGRLGAGRRPAGRMRLEELAGDPDPLVRQAAVQALAR